MKSDCEVMAIGRSFGEALGKALRSMESSAAGFWTLPDPVPAPLDSGPGCGPVSELDAALDEVARPTDGRIYAVERALRLGATVAEVAKRSGIDPWFVDQIAALIELRAEVLQAPVLDAGLLRRA